MKRITRLEIIFCLLAFALIYSVIMSNASITGFVISPASDIALVSPIDNTKTKETSIYFMFKYSPEFEMKECSLILNDEIVQITNALLSPYDTRIRTDMMLGNYLWRIECTDTSNQKLVSETRRLVIGEKEEESELKITNFPNRLGFIYEFELKDNLELDINNVVPNDVIRANREKSIYDISILRLIQDYGTGTELVDLLITPGNKRVRLNQGDTVSIDFNNDGQDDIRLTLNDVSYRKALFTVSTKEKAEIIEEAEQKPPAIEEPSIIISHEEEKKEVKVKEQEPAQIPEQAQAGGLVELVLIGLIVILVITIISTAKRRKEEEKKYITTLRKRTAVKRPKKKVKKRVMKKKAKKKAAKKKPKKKIVKKKATKKKVPKKKAKKKK